MRSFRKRGRINKTVGQSTVICWSVCRCILTLPLICRCVSTLITSAAILEDISRQSLSEVVGTLFCRWYTDNVHIAIADLVPEEVPFYIVMAGATGDTVFGGKGERAAVIFMNGGADVTLDVTKGRRYVDKMDEL